MAKNPCDFAANISGYRATVGLPNCLFYQELMEAYPQTKVLLTVRDPESCHESASQTILSGPKAASSYMARLFFGLIENELPGGHEDQHDVDADGHEEEEDADEDAPGGGPGHTQQEHQ